MLTTARALVIDDDRVVRKIVARELQMLGLQSVKAAEGGAEAVAMMRGGARFDIVLCDLEMPDGDGIEFLRDLGSLCPDADLILMSGADSDVLDAAGNLARQRKLRLLGTVAKPVERQKLASLIALRREAGPSAARMPAADMPPDIEEVRAALDAGEVTIYVQPQLSVPTLELAGVEALARWISPRRGVVPPSQFVALCERASLIDGLTVAVLDRAVEAVSTWREAGLETRVAVNFAASTLSRLDVPDLLRKALQDRGLTPRHILVELTETAVAANVENLLDVATRLRLRGVQLSIDDFGTGYSSLVQLKTLPFSELKIDQSFVGAAHRDAASLAIVESSVRLAHRLGLKVVAEGVETLQDYELIRSLGCDYAQGYLFAKPFDWRELPNWERRRPQLLASLRTGVAC